MSPREACLSLERVEVIAAGDAPSADEQSHLETCAACAETLDGVRADNALFASALGAIAEAPALDRSLDAPEGYVFIEEIHRGAQGVVYLAEQKAAKRRVAVKLTLRGAFASMRQRARFDREVELAASLKHPSIVTVYESGATPSGGRYLAMEYVEGLALDQWFESRRRDPEAVAGVMVELADAIDAAHRRGVIHRDLKPSNILVDSSGTPKVVDFGIAKNVLGDQETQTLQGEFVGTLAYASPEQVTGEPESVDTRADVYALGALLYEGLTGERPVKLSGSLATSIRAIQELDPVEPSVSSTRVGADLDAVCLRALEKDPRDRYQSARELRDELSRYLAGEAVDALSDDVWYRAKKWARKRRKRLTIAGVIVLAVSVTGGLFVAQRTAEGRANIEEFHKTRIDNTLNRALLAVDTETSNAPITSLNDFLTHFAGIVAEELPDSPEIEARIRSSLGIAMTRESQFEEAEENLRIALERWIEASGDSSREAAQARHNLARMYWKRSDYETAEPLYRRALEARRALGDDAALDAARTAHHLASTLQRLGRFDEAVDLFEESLAMRRRLLGMDDPAVANTLNSLGACYMQERRFEEALDRYREARRIIELTGGADDWRAAAVAMNEARCLTRLGRREEARVLLEPAIQSALRTWPENDPRVLGARFSLALVEGDAARATRLAEQLSERVGVGHDDVATAWVALSELYLRRGEWTLACETARRARAEEHALGDTALVGQALLVEAEALERRGDTAEAASLRVTAREILTRELPPDDPLIVRANASGQ